MKPSPTTWERCSFFADVEHKQHGYFALAIPSVAWIREIKVWVEAREGVSDFNVEILHNILSVRRFYDEQVRKNIEVPVKVSV